MVQTTQPYLMLRLEWLELYLYFSNMISWHAQEQLYCDSCLNLNNVVTLVILLTFLYPQQF
jgi:hypothetical protein